MTTSNTARTFFKAAQALVISLALVNPMISSAGEYNKVLSIGDPMPTFANLPSTNGQRLSSRDLEADVIVLVSLANHCPWVKGMDSDLVALVNSMKDQNVTVIGFSVNHREDDRLDAMKAHAEKVGYSFDYVYDESQKLGKALGAVRTPEYFVFDQARKLAYSGLLYNSPAKMDRDGTVRYTKGVPTEFYVRDAVHALLAGERPDVSETRAHGCTVKYEKT